jgi:heme-degrading monooxygenase HmoA
MPILMIMDIEGATAEQYDRVDGLLGGLTLENAPAGLISHAAAVTDTGFMVADVWESAEDLQRFFDDRLGAAIAEAGLPKAEPRIVPVHNHIEGRGEEAGALVLIELDGFTTDDYDALTREMEAHSGDGSAHPAVAHVVGATENGLVVVDIWESGQAFAKFGETELAPRMGSDQMARMQPRVSQMHNHVRVKAPTPAA